MPRLEAFGNGAKLPGAVNAIPGRGEAAAKMVSPNHRPRSIIVTVKSVTIQISGLFKIDGQPGESAPARPKSPRRNARRREFDHGV